MFILQEGYKDMFILQEGYKDMFILQEGYKDMTNQNRSNGHIFCS